MNRGKWFTSSLYALQVVRGLTVNMQQSMVQRLLKTGCDSFIKRDIVISGCWLRFNYTIGSLVSFTSIENDRLGSYTQSSAQMTADVYVV